MENTSSIEECENVENINLALNTDVITGIYEHYNLM